MAGRRAAGDGGLFQRQSGRHKGKWVARIEFTSPSTGKPTRKDYLFGTQAQARDKLRELLVARDRGRVPPKLSISLASYLENWLERRIKPRVSPNTYQRYRSGLRVHIRHDRIAHLQLREIRASTINDFLDRLTRQGVGVATRASVRAVLSAAMQQALKEELVFDNQVRMSDAPRQVDVKLRFLTEIEAKRLMAVAKDGLMKPLIAAAVFTGMRMSELLGLTWDRIDLARSTITIDRQLQRHDRSFYLAPLKTSGGKRTIPMAPVVREQLKALRRSLALNERQQDITIPGLVFTSASGRPLHRKSVLTWTNQLMSEAGVPCLGFHALRHTCASILINRGADALRVQRQLGHSNVRMTLETYSHLFEERLKENVDLLEQALAG